MLDMSGDILGFFEGRPAELSLFKAFAEAVLEICPETEIRVKKTQISFYDRRMFACASLIPVRPKGARPERFITVSFGLAAPIESPRAIPVRVRDNRWTHHVILGDAGEIDGELMDWIAEAHALAARPGR